MRRDVFQAIADPVRREIIELLAREPMTVNAVAENFDISRPAISKHIRILNECGIVTTTKKGRERFCMIEPASLVPAFLWIEQYKKLWEERIDHFEDYLTELKHKRMSETNDLTARTVTIERTFAAPIDLVWEAWTQSEHIAMWWGPKGMDVKVVAHDFREGGKWKYTMMMPDGSEFISEGEYIEIVPGRKLVTSANFLPMTEGVELHVILEPDGDKTHFTFLVVHATEEYRLQQEKMGIYNGWGSAFERLEEFLASKES